VGGGAVGASLARAARGLSVALVAQPRPVASPPQPFDSRVYALSPGNVAFLDRIAVLPRERMVPVHAMRIYGDEGSCLEFDAYAAGVLELAWIVEDAVLQDALWRDLDVEVVAPAQGGIAIDEHAVSVSGLQGKLLVGADGANSAVRKQAGIAVRETDYGQTAVVANFRCEKPHGNVAYQWFRRGAVLALLPLPGQHVSMVWSRPSAIPEQELSAQVTAASRHVLGELSLVTPPRSYPLRRLVAERLVAPRVALCGDAGHVIHPLAGQGLNLGLQDVRTLA
jgi:ubiquinone biosynthesis UbiH/UbiF/VisC/COQ6 family hydroxylase